jgi:hypothetical protein
MTKALYWLGKLYSNYSLSAGHSGLDFTAQLEIMALFREHILLLANRKSLSHIIVDKTITQGKNATVKICGSGSVFKTVTQW